MTNNLDLERIKTLLDTRVATPGGEPRSNLTTDDGAALVTEIERLRAEVERLTDVHRDDEVRMELLVEAARKLFSEDDVKRWLALAFAAYAEHVRKA